MDDRPASHVIRPIVLGVLDYSRPGIQRLESGLSEYDTSIYEVSEFAMIWFRKILSRKKTSSNSRTINFLGFRLHTRISDIFLQLRNFNWSACINLFVANTFMNRSKDNLNRIIAMMANPFSGGGIYAAMAMGSLKPSIDMEISGTPSPIPSSFTSETVLPLSP